MVLAGEDNEQRPDIAEKQCNDTCDFYTKNLDLKSKRLYILSNNSIIFDALKDNILNYFSHYHQHNISEIITNFQKNYFEIKIGDKSIFIEKILPHDQNLITIKKVDLLIIDQIWENNLIPNFRINILVNITNENIIKDEIMLVKPLMLHDLINVVMRSYQDNKIFCCINDDWVYHENLSYLRSNDKIITLTDKENIIFKTLLAKDNFKCEKDYLRFNVWNYHQDSESSTVETHLYKLKAKLPTGLLEIKSSYCQLNI